MGPGRAALLIGVVALGLSTACDEAFGPEGDAWGSCADGLDNDGNGQADCADDGCADRLECSPLPDVASSCGVLRFAAADDVVVRTAAEADAFCASANAVQGDLEIGGATQAISELPCLCTVTGVLRVAGDASGGRLDLAGLHSAGALDVDLGGSGATVAFGGLVGVGGDVALGGPGLRVVDLGTIEAISGALRLAPGSALETLRAPGLTRVDGDVRLDGNVPMRTLGGLTGLQQIGGSLTLRDDADLRHVDGLIALERVDGDVAIEQNPALTNLRGLEGITWVGGDLRIVGNDRLTDGDIDALKDSLPVDAVQGTWIVQDNGGGR